MAEQTSSSPAAGNRIRRHLRLALFLSSFGLPGLMTDCAASRRHASPTYAEPGRTAFQAYCAACHLSTAPVTPSEAPPLDISPWVAGPQGRLIRIVLQGLRGRIEVGGKSYNQEMPAVGKVLTDEQIASLLSFVRKQFSGVSEPVLPAEVGRVRAATRNRDGYWTVEELLNER